AGDVAGDDELVVVFFAVQVGPADRVVGGGRAVDVATLHRHALGVGGGDKTLVHVLPVQVRPADRLVSGVRPVDVATIHSHPKRGASAGNEALVHVLPAQVGPADRSSSNVRPVDAAGRHRRATGLAQQKIICFLSAAGLAPYHDHGGRIK